MTTLPEATLALFQESLIPANYARLVAENLLDIEKLNLALSLGILAYAGFSPSEISSLRRIIEPLCPRKDNRRAIMGIRFRSLPLHFSSRVREGVRGVKIPMGIQNTQLQCWRLWWKEVALKCGLPTAFQDLTALAPRLLEDGTVVPALVELVLHANEEKDDIWEENIVKLQVWIEISKFNCMEVWLTLEATDYGNSLL